MALNAGLAVYAKLAKGTSNERRALEDTPCKFLAVNKYLLMERGQPGRNTGDIVNTTIREFVMDGLIA